MSESENNTSSEVKDACDLLKNLVKHSTALDEFLHLDLTLVAASERKKYEMALLTIHKAMKDGSFSQDDFDRYILGKIES